MSTKFVSRSITSATGSSQTLAAENLARRELYIQNIAATAWYICLTGGTASNGGVDCIALQPGDAIRIEGTNKITAIGTSSSKLTVVER